MTPGPSLLLEGFSEILTCIPGGPDLAGLVRDGSILVGGDRILAVGSSPDWSTRFDLSRAVRVDCSGLIAAPGFVDAHTHVVFGGSRVEEYVLKLTGRFEAHRSSGALTGIGATVAMTRAASEEDLFRAASDRLGCMLAHGATTVESKSGYGLNLEQELKLLRVNRRLAQSSEGRAHPGIVSTFLGAHAFPPDGDPRAYVDEIIEEMIPAVAEMNLARFCDVYIDEGYFDLDQARRILLAAREAGLLLKLHADQYAAVGGSELAAELGVVSVDHLNHTSQDTIRRLADAGVAGVLMPMIDLAVAHRRPFPARAILDSGIPVALATDLCPGGWTESLQLVMQIACRLHGFTPAEALVAATAGGAKALALEDRGVLAPGMRADIQVWDLPRWEEVIYRFGHNSVRSVYRGGVLVYG
ncbi:MAG TPA: imidazolonepropionase [Anaerolineales bacterium]|nr:imidazolonepropionase [Anaerolineales bacterium]